jgi:hypothetical protein
MIPEVTLGIEKKIVAFSNAIEARIARFELGLTAVEDDRDPSAPVFEITETNYNITDNVEHTFHYTLLNLDNDLQAAPVKGPNKDDPDTSGWKFTMDLTGYAFKAQYDPPDPANVDISSIGTMKIWDPLYTKYFTFTYTPQILEGKSFVLTSSQTITPNVWLNLGYRTTNVSYKDVTPKLSDPQDDGWEVNLTANYLKLRYSRSIITSKVINFVWSNNTLSSQTFKYSATPTFKITTLPLFLPTTTSATATIDVTYQSNIAVGDIQVTGATPSSNWKAVFIAGNKITITYSKPTLVARQLITFIYIPDDRCSFPFTFTYGTPTFTITNFVPHIVDEQTFDFTTNMPPHEIGLDDFNSLWQFTVDDQLHIIYRGDVTKTLSKVLTIYHKRDGGKKAVISYTLLRSPS